MATAPTASVKPRIFVTGPPGVGKSSLIMRVLRNLKQAHPSVSIHGFFTQEMRDAAGQRVGFEVITMDGRRARLATATSPSSPSTVPQVGRYTVDLPAFEALVLPELAVSKPDAGLFVLDEVGKMELCSNPFYPAVWQILEAKNVPAVIGTIPITRYGRGIPEVERIKGRPDVEVYTLSKSNRDAMTQVVFNHLLSVLTTQR